MFRASGFSLPVLLAAVVAACSSPQQNGPSIDDPSAQGQFTAVPTMVLPQVSIEPDESLSIAFERVLGRFEAEDIEAFDARRAYTTSAAADFARYFTVNDPHDQFFRTNHVVFVTTQEWSEDNTRDFLLSYLVMPGAPATDAGRPWFHFYSAYPPPFSVEFLFSNTAMGAFEAAVLTELGTAQWTPEMTGAIYDHVTELLERFGLARQEDLSETCPEMLDTLFLAVPHPEAARSQGVFDGQFIPEGSLAAIGLLTGESIRVALAGAAEWEEDDLSEVYPRLRVRDLAEGFLRPISMTVELYVARVELTPTGYCSRMVEMLEESW